MTPCPEAGCPEQGTKAKYTRLCYKSKRELVENDEDEACFVETKSELCDRSECQGEGGCIDSLFSLVEY